MFDRHHAVWPDRLPHHLPLPQTSLFTNLAISALRYPAREALIYYDTPLTYAELERQVLALAGYLQARGVAPSTSQASGPQLASGMLEQCAVRI